MEKLPTFSVINQKTINCTGRHNFTKMIYKIENDLRNGEQKKTTKMGEQTEQTQLVSNQNTAIAILILNIIKIWTVNDQLCKISSQIRTDRISRIY